ncbi:O-antigen ligase family protein [Halomonas sp. YLGW01]|uniref:O-antigen ligase family protein n=1 Tax=Halomonas sp. YLGW01 TaxID=2773308 RepID=UPI00177B1739|nr:O-antigen ligase family protein [Halomonas sp. YLGW01]
MTNKYLHHTLASGWPPLVCCLCVAVGVLLPWQLGTLAFFDIQRGIQWLSLGLVVGIAGFQCRLLIYRNLVDYVSTCLHLSRLVAVLLVGLVLWQVSFGGLAMLEMAYLVLLGSAIIVVAVSVKCYSLLGWTLLGGLLTLLILIYALLAIYHIFLVWGFANRHDFGPGFANVRFFADVAVGVMPLALLYVVARPRPSKVAATLCLAPLSVWWWLLWVSESRAALLGLFAGLLCALWLFGRAARWPVTLLSVSGALGLVGWWILNPIGGGGGDGVEGAFLRDITSSSGRLSLWVDALRYAVEHFPVGIGPMGFAADGNLRSAHAHNLFLNLMAEWGLPLAMLLLAVLIHGCRLIIRRSRARPVVDRPLYACLVMAFVGVMTNAQFAGSHIIPLSALVMVLAIGLVFGYSSTGESGPPECSGPVPIGATLLWACLVLMLAYMLHAGLELYWLSIDSTQTCFEEQGRIYLYPRFWAQGRLECMQMIAPEHWLFWHL